MAAEKKAPAAMRSRASTQVSLGTAAHVSPSHPKEQNEGSQRVPRPLHLSAVEFAQRLAPAWQTTDETSISRRDRA